MPDPTGVPRREEREAFCAGVAWHAYERTSAQRDEPAYEEARRRYPDDDRDAPDFDALARALREMALTGQKDGHALGVLSRMRHLLRSSFRALAVPASPQTEGGDETAQLVDDVAMQVMCRIFEPEEYERAWSAWLAYDKSGWLWEGRALGGFLAGWMKESRPASPTGGRVTEEEVRHALMVADIGYTETNGTFYLYEEIDRWKSNDVVREIVNTLNGKNGPTPEAP